MIVQLIKIVLATQFEYIVLMSEWNLAMNVLILRLICALMSAMFTIVATISFSISGWSIVAFLVIPFAWFVRLIICALWWLITCSVWPADITKISNRFKAIWMNLLITVRNGRHCCQHRLLPTGHDHGFLNDSWPHNIDRYDHCARVLVSVLDIGALLMMTSRVISVKIDLSAKKQWFI